MRTLPVLFFVAAFIAGCSHHRDAPPSALGLVRISDAEQGSKINHASYHGHWEFVRGRHDGRYRGTSARSHNIGDSLALVFAGGALRIYGLTGPNGGDGMLFIAGQRPAVLHFYSPTRKEHSLIYQSPSLKREAHSAALVVTAAAGGRAKYVNVDEIDVLNALDVVDLAPVDADADVNP